VRTCTPLLQIAGAVAEFVSKDLLPLSEEIIIENGGDIYLATSRERTIGIYAGHSPLSLKIGIVISPEDSPLGVCTSSGTVGPSLSFGKADAVCIDVDLIRVRREPAVVVALGLRAVAGGVAD
jgi:ApbE superfamily uncharacterized protein (UPF0280 family)